MSSFAENKIIIGLGMSLNQTYTWSVEYTPVYAKLTITSDVDGAVVVWQTDSATSEITVASQDVTLAVTGASLGTNAGTPAFSTLAVGTYYYAVDFAPSAITDVTYRIQGIFQIVNIVGNVPNVTSNTITLGTGDATVTIVEV